MTVNFQNLRGDFARIIAIINSHRDDLLAIGEEPHRPPAPRWGQDWFPRLDAAAYYAIVRAHRPRRIIEVGAGHSTRFAARAVADGGLATEITCIDPEPRATLDGLPLTRCRKKVQDTDPTTFRLLAPGDILFVDSSHVLTPGSDVDFILNNVLPGLALGALVHFHDIFLPGDYPADWAWRKYNEQSAVATLLDSPDWQVLFASNYVVGHMVETLESGVIGELPLVDGAPESSLWLRKLA